MDFLAEMIQYILETKAIGIGRITKGNGWTRDGRME